MKKGRIYTDTSVVGGCEDSEFAEDSKALLARAKVGEIVLLVSFLLARELAEAPESVTRHLMELPAGAVETVDETEDAFRLRDAYLAARVVGPAHADDALHVALATVARADLIVSWNFKHMVHVDKIRMFNAVNLREGYGLIDIRSPREVV